MFTDKQTLGLSAILMLGFFFSGVFGILDNLFVKIIIGSLFVLLVINLFLLKKFKEIKEVDELSKD